MKIDVNIGVFEQCGTQCNDEWMIAYFYLELFGMEYSMNMILGKLSDGRYPIGSIDVLPKVIKPALIELLENARDIIIEKLDSDFNFQQMFTIEVDNDLYNNAKNEMK